MTSSDFAANLDYLDPELDSVIEGEKHSKKADITILARPSGSAKVLVEEFRQHGATQVKQIASKTVRANFRQANVSEIKDVSSMEAVEMDRPVIEFDSGN